MRDQSVKKRKIKVKWDKTKLVSHFWGFWRAKMIGINIISPAITDEKDDKNDPLISLHK